MRSVIGLLPLTMLVAVFAVLSPPLALAGEAYTFEMDDHELDYSGGVADDVTVTVKIIEDPFGSDYPQDTEGFQMGIAYDDEAISISEPDDDDELMLDVLQDLDDGNGPSFFSVDFDPVGGPGMTIGCIYDPFGGGTLAFKNPENVFEFTVQANEEFLAQGGELETELEFVDTLGVPEHLNQVVVDGIAQFPSFRDSTITYIGLDTIFVRGDLDGDGRVRMLDAFVMILSLFQDGPEITCEAAADLTEDEELTTDDILYILEYAFIDGPEPTSPFPDCGAGTGSCESYDYCD